MKLDKFQQFVKGGPIWPNFDKTTAKAFVRRLITDFPDKASDIESNVNGAIGFDEIYSNSVFCVESLSIMSMDAAIKLHVNELIQATIEEIEDIECDDDFEPEDCCDAHKRDLEINQ